MFYRQQIYYVSFVCLRDGSFIFASSCLSLENINYLINDITFAGTESYVLLFVVIL